MAHYLTLDELENEIFTCSLIECHRQIWKHRSKWLGNLHTPRRTDGLILVCSPIHAIFHDLQGESITATKGDVLYIPKDTLYTVDFWGGGSNPDMFTMNIALQDANGAPIRLGDRMKLLLSGASPDCRYLATELHLLCLNPRSSPILRRARFLELLSSLTDSARFSETEHAQIYRGIRSLIEEWDQNHKIERYADICQISESSFYQHFKDWAGISPNEYRTNMRITAAKSLLRNSTLSIREIAAQIGFADPYYFSRCFRKATGVAPQIYRGKKCEDEF